MSELAALLSELVSIPSPNPPGDSREMAQFVAAWLGATGADIKKLHPAEKT